jgi:hypothetical protein
MELQFEFEITERSIAGEESAPAYAAVHLLSDMGPSRTIALSSGGSGKYLGWYPEIEKYLAEVFNIPLSIQYHDDKDTLSIDYAAASKLTWTYHRSPAAVVVKDQPRA